MKCSKCNAELRPGALFCGSCGTPVGDHQPFNNAPVGNICPNCGTIAAEGAAFCRNCGTKLKAAEEEAPAVNSGAGVFPWETGIFSEASQSADTNAAEETARLAAEEEARRAAEEAARLAAEEETRRAAEEAARLAAEEEARRIAEEQARLAAVNTEFNFEENTFGADPVPHMGDGFKLPEDNSFVMPTDNSFTTPADNGFKLPEDNGFTMPADNSSSFNSYSAPADSSFNTYNPPVDNTYVPPVTNNYDAPADNLNYGIPQHTETATVKRGGAGILIATIALGVAFVVAAALLVISFISSNSQISDLKGQLVKLEGEAKNDDKAIADLEKTKTDLEKKKKELEKKIKDLNSQIEEKDKSIEKLEDDMASLEATLDIYKEGTKDKEQLQAQLAEKQSELTAVQNEYDKIVELIGEGIYARVISVANENEYGDIIADKLVAKDMDILAIRCECALFDDFDADKKIYLDVFKPDGTKLNFNDKLEEHSDELAFSADKTEIKKVYRLNSYPKGQYIFQIVYGDEIIFTGSAIME